MHTITRTRLLALTGALLFGAAACGGDKVEPPPPGSEVTIERFSASLPKVARGQKVTLSWKVTGPDGLHVVITATPGGELTNSTMAEGTIESAAITADTTFKLVATAGSQSANREITVPIDPNAVAVISFDATPNPAPRGANTVLSWTTGGATQVRLLDGATELLNTNNMTQVSSGTFTAPTPNATHVFKIEASSASGNDMKTVTVMTEAPGAIRSLRANPSGFSGPSASVSVSWGASGNLTMTQNGTAVAGFTGTETGTITVTVNDTTTFELVAVGGGIRASRSVTVTKVVGETEPNNDIATATPITGGAAGEIPDGADDEDYYSIQVPEGGYVIAEITDGAGDCAFDSVLELLDSAGELITDSDDEGVGLCPFLDAHRDPLARELTAGTYYLHVRPFSAGFGPYVLVVTIGTAGCGNTVVESGRDEQCDDGNTADGDSCSSTCQIMALGEITGAFPQENTFTGALTQAGRVDYYRVTLPAEGYIFAETGVPTIGSCAPTGANDTILTLLDSTFTVLGSINNDPDVTPCSRIDPALDDFAHVQAGTYYVQVSSSANESISSYSVLIKTLGLGCGNNIYEEPELCDDGNTAAGDGCSATCTIEIDGMVSGGGGAVNVTLRPGTEFPRVVQVTVTEAQSITATTSGMSGGCPFNTGMALYDSTWTGLGQVFNETGCASFDAATGDTFAGNLAAGVYYIIVAVPQTAAGGAITVTVTINNPRCGNNIIENVGAASEHCDDGNTMAGDGCSATCTVETAANIQPPGGNANITLGTNPIYVQVNITQPGQSFSVTTSNGTGANCTVRPDIYMFSYDLQTRLGYSYADETGMACTKIDPLTQPFASDLPVGPYLLRINPWVGTGALSVVVAITNPSCGNGIRERLAATTEQCDDHNTTNGDGCSSVCRFEGTVTVETEPNDAVDMNNVPTQATPITVTRGGPAIVVAGDISAEGDHDYYSFTIPAGQTATLEANTYSTLGDPASTCSSSQDTELTLFNASGGEIFYDDDIALGTNSCSSLTGDPSVAGLAPGTYYLLVQFYLDGGTFGPYFLNVRLIP